jgi:SH3 domain-containing protein
MTQPSWTAARLRVDNYASGFIGAGAGAVIADAYVDVAYDVRSILAGGNMLAAWRANPAYKNHEHPFASVRRPGFTNYLDPDGTSSNFYRAITTTPGFTTIPPAPLAARTSTAVKLRSKPSETSSVVATIPNGTSLSVSGDLVADSRGRTWVPVRMSNGKPGYVAGWLVRLTGTAVATTGVIFRSAPALTAKSVETIGTGQRVTIIGSAKDGAYRVWLNVKASSGHTGWVAAWLTRP